MCQYQHIQSHPDSLPDVHNVMVNEEIQEINVDKSKEKIDTDEKEISAKYLTVGYESFKGTDISEQEVSFITSTPKKQNMKCDKCIGQSLCEECLLDEYVENYLTNKRML